MIDRKKHVKPDSYRNILDNIEKDRATYIFFGGIGGQMAIPWFEFVGVASQLGDVNCIFFRDPTKTWYHGVYKKIVPDIMAVLRSAGNNEKLIFVGNSMGGYAAYWFGHIFGADEVIMFSPQTCISYEKKVQKWGDPSQEVSLVKTRKHPSALHDYFDLSKLNTKNDVHIYYSSKNSKDTLHANNLERSNVTLHPFDEKGHNVVTVLLHRERLIPILKGDHGI